ncbi:STAS domain-containing protein [Spongiactinospora sp. 9N601]|uniref:STAS domain-containing protein n=1 Tax=Spongiactinospora sp. 9N601 TaxID=3375149 RepID=UPI0037A3E91F
MVVTRHTSPCRVWTQSADAVIYLDGILRITYTPAPRCGRALLVGELDATNIPAVAPILAQTGAEDTLTIDVGLLEFVDMAGLRILTGLCRDGAARLTNIPTGMRRVLALLSEAEADDLLPDCA